MYTLDSKKGSMEQRNNWNTTKFDVDTLIILRERLTLVYRADVRLDILMVKIASMLCACRRLYLPLSQGSCHSDQQLNVKENSRLEKDLWRLLGPYTAQGRAAEPCEHCGSGTTWPRKVPRGRWSTATSPCCSSSIWILLWVKSYWGHVDPGQGLYCKSKHVFQACRCGSLDPSSPRASDCWELVKPRTSRHLSGEENIDKRQAHGPCHWPLHHCSRW